MPPCDFTPERYQVRVRALGIPQRGGSSWEVSSSCFLKKDPQTALPATEPSISGVLSLKSLGASELSYPIQWHCMSWCVCETETDRGRDGETKQKETENTRKRLSMTIYVSQGCRHRGTHTKKYIDHKCEGSHFILSHMSMHNLNFLSPPPKNIKLSFCSQANKY